MSLGTVCPEGYDGPLVLFELGPPQRTNQWFKRYPEGRIVFHLCGHFCSRYTTAGQVACCACNTILEAQPELCKVCYYSQTARSSNG